MTTSWVETILAHFHDTGLAIKRKKCLFGVSELKFLGYNFSPEGMQPVRQKMEAIKVFPAPTSAKALLGFLGALNNYYRRCLAPINGKMVSEILQPLYEAAMAKTPGKKFQTGLEEKHIKDPFQMAKVLLVRTTDLSHPNPHAPIVITTDASDYTVG